MNTRQPREDNINSQHYDTSCPCFTGKGVEIDISSDPSGKTTCNKKTKSRLPKESILVGNVFY